jgi:hypothetical protein
VRVPCSVFPCLLKILRRMRCTAVLEENRLVLARVKRSPGEEVKAAKMRTRRPPPTVTPGPEKAVPHRA